MADQKDPTFLDHGVVRRYPLRDPFNGRSPVPTTTLPEISPAPVGASNDQLAAPAPDCGATQLSQSLNEKVDEATVHIVSELDQLKEQIEQLKARIIEDAGLVKSAVANHFTLGGEALAFRRKVSQRLGLK
jgi:hypothetical protein